MDKSRQKNGFPSHFCEFALLRCLNRLALFLLRLSRLSYKRRSKDMLQVDLKQPDARLAEYIASCCSAIGRVLSVTIHRSPTAFALVEMGHHMPTLELAGQYGGSAFGTSVLIHLQQKPQ